MSLVGLGYTLTPSRVPSMLVIVRSLNIQEKASSNSKDQKDSLCEPFGSILIFNSSSSKPFLRTDYTFLGCWLQCLHLLVDLRKNTSVGIPLFLCFESHRNSFQKTNRMARRYLFYRKHRDVLQRPNAILNHPCLIIKSLYSHSRQGCETLHPLRVLGY